MIHKCKISTPQFWNGGQVHHYHEQEGIINTLTWEFTPFEFENDNHSVWFHGRENFEKAAISCESQEYIKPPKKISPLKEALRLMTPGLFYKLFD